MTARYTHGLLLTERDSGDRTEQSDSASIVRNLAHELRQPLSTMESIAYYLRLTSGAGSSVAIQVEKLQEMIQHANAILADTVHYLQAAPLQIDVQDVNELAHDAASRLPSRLQRRLSLTLPEPHCLIDGDLLQMRHMLAATLHFCFRVSEDGSVVSFLVEDVHKHAHLRFQARLGIALPINLEDWFSPLREHTPVISGLGLAAVRKIAEAHSGQCRLRREPTDYLTVEIGLPVH